MHGRVFFVSFAAKGIRRKKSQFNKYRLSIRRVRTNFREGRPDGVFMRKKAGKA